MPDVAPPPALTLLPLGGAVEAAGGFGLEEPALVLTPPGPAALTWMAPVLVGGLEAKVGGDDDGGGESCDGESDKMISVDEQRIYRQLAA